MWGKSNNNDNNDSGFNCSWSEKRNEKEKRKKNESDLNVEGTDHKVWEEKDRQTYKLQEWEWGMKRKWKKKERKKNPFTCPQLTGTTHGHFMVNDCTDADEGCVCMCVEWTAPIFYSKSSVDGEQFVA